MAGQIIIRVLVSSLVPQASKPEHVSGNTWWGAKGTGKSLGLESAEKVPRVVTVLFLVWAQALGKYQHVEKETDMLLSTLSAMQEKAQHLECNLSAETRIKLDLFSALGDTRRQLEIAQGFSLHSSLLRMIVYIVNNCLFFIYMF